MICLETLKPQLDHDEPSYAAALARCQRAAAGAAAKPDGILTPFGMRAITPERAPILPDPPGAQRRAPGALPRRAHPADDTPRRVSVRRGRPSPNRDRALALLAALGRPATADEIAPGDKGVQKALANARGADLVKTRQVISPAYRSTGGWRAMYALPSMEWPELPPDARYYDGPRQPRGEPLSKTQAQAPQRRRHG